MKSTRPPLLISALVVAMLAAPLHAVSPDLVISQVYGGGGSAGSYYNADYVELFNRGTAGVALNGKSLQYASSTGNFTTVAPLNNAVIPAGGRFLIQLSSGASGIALPTPDQVSGSVFMSNTSGKVALVNQTTVLACGSAATPCGGAQSAAIIDLAGYGVANWFEGTGAMPALSISSIGVRKLTGCQDTDSNSFDFTAEPTGGLFAPRNSGAAATPCAGGPVITTTNLPTGEVGAPYPLFQIAATGGTPPYVFTSVSGAPAGLTLAMDGYVTGKPSVPGTGTWTVKVTDSQALDSNSPLGVQFVPPPAVLESAPPGGNVGVAYAHTLLAAGGLGVKTWTLASGTLPPGLALAEGGEITGIPSHAGSYTFLARVADGSGVTDDGWFTIIIVAPNSSFLLNSRLPDGMVGVPFPSLGIRMVLGGGVAPYTVSADVSGPLPPGLFIQTFNNSIAGTPTTPGSYTVVLNATDATPATTSRTYRMIIRGRPELADWKPRAGDGGPLTGIFPSPSYHTDGTLFVKGGQGELFRSRDRGRNWTRFPINPAAQNFSIESVGFSPTFNGYSTSGDEATVFVAGRNLGLWKSTDGGASWSQGGAGLPCVVSSRCLPNVTIAVSPNFTTDRIVFLALTDGANTARLYRSTDAGANFSLRSTLSGQARITRLTPSPNFGADQMLLMFSNAGLQRSIDGGQSFTLVLASTNFLNYGSIAISPEFATDATVAVSHTGPALYESTDGGANFQFFTDNAAWPKHRIYRIFVTRRPGATPLWTAISDDYDTLDTPSWKLLQSDDGLTSYAPLRGAGLPNRRLVPALNFEVAPVMRVDGVTDLFHGEEGMLVSHDNGDSFSSGNAGLRAGVFYNISQAGSEMLACGYRELYRSSDFGRNWSKVIPPFTAGNNNAFFFYCALSPNYATDRTLFIHTRDNSFNPVLQRSTDGGRTFTAYNYGLFSVSKQVFLPGFDPVNGVSFIAHGQLRKSVDGGRTWTQVTTMNPTCDNNAGLSDIVVSPNYATDQTLFITGANNFCRSSDGGATWTPIRDGANQLTAPIAVSPVYDHGSATNGPARTLFANGPGSQRIFRSIDDGATWTLVGGQPAPLNQFLSGRTVPSPSYASDGVLFFHFGGNEDHATGLYRSTDYGVSMSQVSTGSPAVELDSHRVSLVLPAADFNGGNSSSEVIAVASGSGFWRSTNSGANFYSAGSARFASENILSLARAPGNSASTLAGDGEAPAAVVTPGTLIAGTSDRGVFRSDDGGTTFDDISVNLPDGAVLNVAIPPQATSAALAAVSGQGLWRYNGTSWTQQSAPFSPTGNYGSTHDDGNYMQITCGNGMSIRCARNFTGCASMSATETDLARIDSNSSTGPTTLQDAQEHVLKSKFARPAAEHSAPNGVVAVTASMWAVSAAYGPRFSIDSGMNWTAAPGSNDYAVPAGQTWQSVSVQGINPASGGREVLAGSAAGLWRTVDGGATWRRVDGAGSGLEASSKNFSTLITAQTAAGTTDILVGATGSTTGGVWLSGDGGEHWTQINQGYDPATLSISTLIKTSCAGCPVQYYSGSYGGGLYTRTVTVSAPPAATGWCTGASCVCGSGAFTGPEQGGTAFSLCGTGFQAGAVVEFDGVAATGCTLAGSTRVNCSGTPAHPAGAAVVRVRNPDTRRGVLAAPFTYTAGAARAANSLRVAKSGSNANLSWTCTGCSSAYPGRLYRAQNAALSLFTEHYAVGTASNYSNTGAMASAQSYFWSVE